LESVEKLEPLLKAGDFEGVLLTFAREIALLPEEVIAFMQTLPSWQASVDMAPTIVAEVLAVKSYTFDPENFRSLATPTLLLVGSESPTYMQVATEAVATALPHSQTVMLTGQGHGAIFTDPELVLREVIPFLTEE